MRRKTLVMIIIFFVSIHFETPLQYFIEKELLIPIYSNPIPYFHRIRISRKMIFGSV